MSIGHEYPKQSLVRILKEGVKTIGLGLLVDYRHVLTCAHVVAKALDLDDQTPDLLKAQVPLDFPYIGNLDPLMSEVVCWSPPHLDSHQGEIGDIAVLRLGSGKPNGAIPTPLSRSKPVSGHRFKAMGYSSGYEFVGVFARGVIIDALPNGCIQIERANGGGMPVQEGFSGAPVWDEQLKGVVGIIVSSLKKDGVGFFIPAQLLPIYFLPIQTDLLEFLDKYRKNCFDINVRFRTPHLLNALFDDLSKTKKILEIKQINPALFCELEEVVKNYVKSHMISKKGKEYQWVEWYNLEPVKVANSEAICEGAREISSRHILIGILLSDNSVAKKTKEIINNEDLNIIISSLRKFAPRYDPTGGTTGI